MYKKLNKDQIDLAYEEHKKIFKVWQRMPKEAFRESIEFGHKTIEEAIQRRKPWTSETGKRNYAFNFKNPHVKTQD